MGPGLLSLWGLKPVETSDGQNPPPESLRPTLELLQTLPGLLLTGMGSPEKALPMGIHQLQTGPAPARPALAAPCTSWMASAGPRLSPHPQRLALGRARQAPNVGPVDTGFPDPAPGGSSLGLLPSGSVLGPHSPPLPGPPLDRRFPLPRGPLLQPWEGTRLP